jgi:hypothetical protein
MPKALERQITFEGTWEEVTERAGDLSGRRVTLTVHPDLARSAEGKETLGNFPPSLAEILAPLLEEADRLEPEPAARNADESALDTIMRNKAERLGLSI